MVERYVKDPRQREEELRTVRAWHAEVERLRVLVERLA